MQDYSSILLWLAGIEEASDWFQEGLESVVTGYEAFNYILDADLRSHVSDYIQDIEDCRKVLLVAHSQGNFYGNQAWEFVYQNTLGNFPYNHLKLMGIVAIATPASHVGTSLAYTEDLPAVTRYLTLTDDLVINAIRSVNFGPLPGNLSNSSEGEDWMSHSFTGTYISGTPSRNTIRNQVKTVAFALETLPFERQWLNSSALASAGYDPAARILEVQFASDSSVYRYYDVPGEVYHNLISADSIGKYYNLYVRGHYPSRRLF